MTPEEIAEIRGRGIPHGPGAVWTLTADRDALIERAAGRTTC